jgi:hypothetical protein
VSDRSNKHKCSNGMPGTTESGISNIDFSPSASTPIKGRLSRAAGARDNATSIDSNTSQSSFEHTIAGSDEQSSAHAQHGQLGVTLANLSSGRFVRAENDMTEAKERFVLSNNGTFQCIGLETIDRQTEASDEAIIEEFETLIQLEITAQGQAAISFAAANLTQNDPTGACVAHANSPSNVRTVSADPTPGVSDPTGSFKREINLQEALPELELHGDVQNLMHKFKTAASTSATRGYRHRVVTSDDGQKHYVTRLGETLRSIAVVQLDDVSLWTLIAQKNDLPTGLDAKGIPVSVLTRGTHLLMPIDAEISSFRKTSADSARSGESPRQHANTFIVDHSQLLEPNRKRTTFDAIKAGRSNVSPNVQNRAGIKSMQQETNILMQSERRSEDHRQYQFAVHQPRCHEPHTHTESSQSSQRLHELLRARVESAPRVAVVL